MNKLNTEALKRNEKLLLFYFLYTTFQGSLRKWVFVGASGINDILFMVQLLMPFIVVSLMMREKTVLSCKPLVPYAFLLGAMALNPLNQSLFHGIFGFILHFGFWLIMLVYLNEREAFPIENLAKLFLIVTIGEALLTFVQFGLPTSHFLNRYENAGQDEIAGFANDGGVRVIGSFSYISGYGSFLFFVGLFVWALMVQKKWASVVILSLAGLGLVSSFMNGSRAVVLPYIICVVFGFLNYGAFSQKIKTIALVIALFMLSVIFNLGAKLSFIEKSFTSINQRFESGQQSGEASSRTAGIFAETIEFSGKYPLLGMGLGATYQGATNKWGRSQSIIEYGYYEEEPERVIIEGGYLLLFVRIFLFAYIAIKMKIPKLFSIPLLFYMFFFTIFMFNAYQVAYVFFGLALLDKFYYLNTLSSNYLEDN
jgi:hypothetical protein